MNTLTKDEKKHLKALRRRLDWLSNRIYQLNNTFDRAERTALVWLIKRADMWDEIEKTDVREVD